LAALADIDLDRAWRSRQKWPRKLRDDYTGYRSADRPLGRLDGSVEQDGTRDHRLARKVPGQRRMIRGDDE